MDALVKLVAWFKVQSSKSAGSNPIAGLKVLIPLNRAASSVNSLHACSLRR
jgi:hypothetical protein